MEISEALGTGVCPLAAKNSTQRLAISCDFISAGDPFMERYCDVWWCWALAAARGSGGLWVVQPQGSA